MISKAHLQNCLIQSKKHLLVLLLSCSSVLFGQTPDWNVNASSFEHSMSVTCVVVDELGTYSSEDLMIGFFDGDECVGVGYTDTYFPPVEANLAFVLAYGNSAMATYTIKVYSNEQIFDAGTIDFSSNGVLGTLDAPYVISPVYTIEGCTDSTAYNYNPIALEDDGSCEAIVIGCTDASAYNFNPIANTDDDSCIPVVIGCMDANYVEYNSEANSGFQDVLCLTEVVYGCTNSDYIQYNLYANVDDSSCSTTWQQAYVVSQEDFNELEFNQTQLLDSVLQLNLLIESLNQSNEMMQDSLLNCSVQISTNLPMGWSIFGCALSSSKNTEEAVACILDKVVIIKNYLGAVYLPEFDFNGIGNLQPGWGYQIKLTESVEGFNLCE